MNGRIVNKNRPLNVKKKFRFTSLIILASIVSVIMITGITLAWFHFKGGTDEEISVGKVELITNVDKADSLATVMPGETIVTSSSFSKTQDGQSCYVRANLEYYSNASLNRAKKNYLLALNTTDYAPNLSTGVDGVKWMSTYDNYYYLVDNDNNLIKVNDTTVYNFGEGLKFPSVIDIEVEGLEMEYQIPDLHLNVKFQAIQSEYLPSYEFDDIVDTFDICFKTKPKSEFLVRFVDENGGMITPQVIKNGEKVNQPTDGDGKFELYLDEEMTEQFDIETDIDKSYTLYGKWVEGESTFTEGLIFVDNKLIGYVGDSQNVIVPASYSLSGERTLVSSTSNRFDDFYVDILSLDSLFALEYDVFPLTIVNGGVRNTCNDMDEFQALGESLDLMNMQYPVTVEYYIDEAVEGEDYSVTTIGAYAFMNHPKAFSIELAGQLSPTQKKNMGDVIISEGITTIEEGAFGAQTINTITLPSTLDTIGEYAFTLSTILSLHIPSTVTNIAANAFEQSTIFEVYNETATDLESQGANIMVSLDSLNNSMFYKYQDGGNTLYFAYQEGFDAILVSATTAEEFLFVPNSGTTLTHLYSDTTVTLADMIIYDNAFLGEHKIKKAVMGNNVLGIMGKAFSDCINLEILSVGNNISEVAYDAFTGSNLINVLVNNQSIANLFGSSISLTSGSVYILQVNGYSTIQFEDSQSGLYEIGYDADEYKWIKIPVDNQINYYKATTVVSNIKILQGFDFDEGKLTDYDGDDENVVIPASYSIGLVPISCKLSVLGWDIYGAQGTITLIKHDGEVEYNNVDTFLADIENYINEGTYTQEQVMNWSVRYFLESFIEGDEFEVTSIESSVFYNNQEIKSVTIPSSVTIIKNGAFRECKNLTTVEFSEGLITIEEQAFFLCSNLSTINSLPTTLQNLGKSAFGFCDKLALNALPTGIINMEDNPFIGCVNLNFISNNGQYYYIEGNCIIERNTKKVVSGFNTSVIPNDILNIGNNAFYACENFYASSLPSGLVSIGEDAFYRCMRLTWTSLPAGITNIGGWAFHQCNNLALTSLPSGLTVINDWVFEGCDNIALTSLPSGVTSIGSCAFRGCVKLALTTLPDGVTSIDSEAFSDCVNITLSSLPSGVTSIGAGVFRGCTNITLSSLPSGITRILYRAFYGCINITLSSLPSGVTSIGEEAFYDCINITLSSLPSGVTSIDEEAFYGCINITLLRLPSGVTSIGVNAFYGCTNLNYILCESSAVATLISGKGREDTYIYLLQASGYSGLVETEVIINDSVTIYTAVDADGYKWVRTSDNKYYKCKISTGN